MLCRKFYKNFEKIMKNKKNTKNNLYIKFPYSFRIVLTVSNSFFACAQCTLVLHINNKLIQIQIHIEYISVCVGVCVCAGVCVCSLSPSAHCALNGMQMQQDLQRAACLTTMLHKTPTNCAKLILGRD